uniref:CCHC-type domain-containing protein n=1 Tax=Trichogramma kaykai TaxID=54128 RepID=A0ABD2VW25_9HYME
MSPPTPRARPKRYPVTAASRKPDVNNNEVDDKDGFSLVNRRRRRQRNQSAAIDDPACTRQQPKLRKDTSTYAGILKTLKSEPTLQKTIGSSVQSIRRSAAGALVLQLRKSVENAPSLGVEVGKVLGDVATANTIQHTTMIEIKDLDEYATKTEIAEELVKSLGALHLNEEIVNTLPKAYAGTQTAVAALPDDLATKALKLCHLRIGWVNCRIRGCEDALRCYCYWSPGHVLARCRGSDLSGHCFRCGQTDHRMKDCKNNPTCVFCQELTTTMHPQASTVISRRSPTKSADDEGLTAKPQSLQGGPEPPEPNHSRATHQRGRSM